MQSIKWQHYNGIYDTHFPSNPKSILEIGVREGGSLLRWNKQFPDATIVGMDINPPPIFEHIPNIHCYTGSQADTYVLKRMADWHAPFDIIIDDGSHRPYHQIASFNALWPHVKEGGCYIVEDMHMQGKLRWKLYNLFRPNIYRTSLNMAKAQDLPIADNAVENRHYSIHFYPHCIVFKKQTVTMNIVETDY